MLITALFLIAGLALLVFGADTFVKGAAGLASRFGVPPIVVGLTVVAYGTSMPELVVSTVAALDGRSAISLGNVIGSNIANIGLILGITALVSPPLVEGTLIRREIPMLLLATAALPLVLLDNEISRTDATLLFLGSIAFTVLTVLAARKADPSDLLVASTIEEVEERESSLSPLKLSALSIVGLGMLLLGGDWFVDGAVQVAEAFGVSERVIGLTVVAIGTSLPELAASVVAALRGHSAMAVGNVIGSNIFNVLLVLGATGLIQPVRGDFAELWPDLALMLGFTLLAAFVLRGEREISRVEGGVMLGAYLAAILWLAQ